MERAEQWQKPWTFGIPEGQRFVRPVNLDGRAYRGINVPLLWSAGFEPATWGTFNAWKKIGASVGHMLNRQPAACQCPHPTVLGSRYLGYSLLDRCS
jgi:hypothetical protein